ncbi:elongation factor Ts [Pseudoalteromonas phenolica]|uniref:spondin domain-containing protein n=1 Tax=Pseudoalteromonas phenolica TaxID=161398 RepID=UPI00110BA159|nr:spondin domain-containing protein [Pseudoalteromonas phenolica]TMN93509.1 elongation factor Ts [Pseudoalteromonas phenolica]
MNKLIQFSTVLSFTLLTACGGGSSSNSTPETTTPTTTPASTAPADTVTYELTFTQEWTAANFATNYPSGTHFSPLVGLTHNLEGGIFKRDEVASPGIVLMAETGGKSTLKNEISDIQNAGHSNYLIDESGISNGSQSVTFTFEASQDFPLLSVVSMIAPSPDWFVAINSLSLFNDNTWVESQTIELKVYDAGSDSGLRFSSGNLATDPAEPITLLSSERDDTDFAEGIHHQTGKHIGYIEIKLMQ